MTFLCFSSYTLDFIPIRLELKNIKSHNFKQRPSASKNKTYQK